MLTVREPVFESVGVSIDISRSALSDDNLPALSFTLRERSAKEIRLLFVSSGEELHDATVTATATNNKVLAKRFIQIPDILK